MNLSFLNQHLDFAWIEVSSIQGTNIEETTQCSFVGILIFILKNSAGLYLLILPKIKVRSLGEYKPAVFLNK